MHISPNHWQPWVISHDILSLPAHIGARFFTVHRPGTFHRAVDGASGSGGGVGGALVQPTQSSMSTAEENVHRAKLQKRSKVAAIGTPKLPAFEAREKRCH